VLQRLAIGGYWAALRNTRLPLINFVLGRISLA
jgi:hypothetical protein